MEVINVYFLKTVNLGYRVIEMHRRGFLAYSTRYDGWSI